MAVQGVLGDLPNQYGDWVRKRILGSGAFGSVHLWKNNRNGQEIAIKKCLNKPKPQAMKRWETEVNMMEKMKNPNIVSFMRIPEVLTGEYPQKYSLGMEYCPEGDLRKFMGRAVYCCGLTECHVRDLMADIGSAIHYLHEEHNLHRDLKPENIVIKRRPEVEGRYTFKVTDLGYAKDLDVHSCGKSFVGTLYYLAPEVFNVELRYYSQVDYWSFGVLSFESITGYRPFFKHSPAPQVLDFIKKKKEDSICAWFEGGKPRYWNSLPDPHHLNPHFAGDMAVWLRLMLHNDPNKRGNGRQWYRNLNETLSKKYINVFNITTMKMLTLPIQDQSYLQKVRMQIHQETGIEKADQLLLLKDGIKPDENVKVIKSLWREHSAEEWVTYLLYDTGENTPTYQCTIPAKLRSYSGLKTDRNETQYLMRIALYTVLENVKLAKYFINAILCLKQSVARQGRHFIARSREFTHFVFKCSGMVYIMKKSLETDLAECGQPDSVDGMPAFSNFIDQCHEMEDHVQKWEKKIDKAITFSRDCDKEFSSFDKLSTLSSDLGKQFKYFSTFEDNAILRYDSVRREIQALRESDKSDGESRSNECRRRSLLTFISEFVKGSIDQLSSVTGRCCYYPKMRELLSQQKKISEMIFKLEGKFFDIQQVHSDVCELQSKHKISMWKLLNYIKDVHSKARDYNEEDVSNMFSFTEQHKLILNDTIHSILNDPTISQVLHFAPHSSSPSPVLLATPNADSSSADTPSYDSIMRPEYSSSVTEEPHRLSNHRNVTSAVQSTAHNGQILIPNQHSVALSEVNTNNNNSRSGVSDLEISGASSDFPSYKEL